ncbi:cytochrome P450 [Chondromyces apiculatus]|uniref:Putative cytochrome P450 hydroxylase n=1 Tax=Chondromyces apiculatus DSM 436 TaxID=1192034 RepID=A0A017SXY5_9BACT|nr:cytochrome P450 [Chondromyces apiculatus]EYF01854.1 putative cytochrome P450 hydroxylase [Chondromyces apiculatus DSM 436]
MTADAVPTLPISRTCPYGPRPEHRQLREEAPIAKVILPNGRTGWAVTSHKHIRAILSDPRFSSSRRNPGFPTARPNAPPSALKPLMLELDAPDHGPVRRTVIGEFTVQRMNALGPRIQEIVDQHIDAMLAGPRPVDLVQALSLPVPSLVICEMLGVPYADHDFFQTRSSTLVSYKTTQEELTHALGELTSYLGKLVAAKMENPTDDLLSRLIQKQRENGGVDFGDLVGMAFLLLIAGHETTANMISLSTLMLLQHPEKLEALRQDPSKTLGAVEELLRYFTIAESALGRVAREDVELDGVTIRAGEGVLMLANTGNRDPEVFENADALNIDRGARNHLAFGFGQHQCLGQNLARMELQIVIDTLFKRIPGLRPAVPLETLSFKEDASVYGIREFPVTW